MRVIQSFGNKRSYDYWHFQRRFPLSKVSAKQPTAYAQQIPQFPWHEQYLGNTMPLKLSNVQAVLKKLADKHQP